METKSVRKSVKIAVFSLLSASLLSSHALASSFGLSSRTDTQVRQSSSSKFDVLVPAKAKNGISYNVFSKFELSGKPLTLVNTDDTSGGVRGTGKADLIVIESNNISLKDQFTILGSPADILFITRSASGKLSCEQCSFDNVGRVTMAAATPSYAKNAKTINSVGELTTVGGGKVTVKGLVSPGLQSLELIAENIDTSGTIDTNLRAENHPESGMIIVDRGSKVVGAGGISMFTGRLKVSYAKLAIESATLSTAWSTIKGKFRAATIAVASPNNIKVDADMSTMSDALSTSQHRGKLYAPTEGIFVQSLGKYKNPSHQNIHISANAKLSTDNHLSLKSLSTVRILKQGNKQAKVIGGDMTLIARNDVHQQGYVAADEVKVSANQFINNGVVESANIDVETEKSIYNSFGGKVLGKNVTLYSKSGSVINGSLVDKVVYLDNVLTIGGEGYEVKKQFGIWQALKDHSAIKSANSASNLSASILADNLDIQAKRIENINPYYLEKSNSVNWDAGIRVNGIKANQVAIEAERSLKLKASGYVLNSSAIMGLNGGGEFLVNSPIFSNERYEISFESYPYRVVEYSSDDNKKDMANYKYGTETKILTYSPPGRVFSFGDFQFSRGGTSDPKKVESSKLFNEVSYFQAFKDARFFNSEINSIGLEVGTNYTQSDFKGATDCLSYRKCNRQDVVTRTEAETLLSFQGNVSGVKGQLNSESDLIVANIEPLLLEVQGIINDIISNYIEKNKSELERFFKINNNFYKEYYDYEFKFQDLSRVGDYVEGKVILCQTLKKKYNNEPWFEGLKDETCHENHKRLKENWKLIHDKMLAERDLGDTGYTLRQLKKAAFNYVLDKGPGYYYGYGYFNGDEYELDVITKVDVFENKNINKIVDITYEGVVIETSQDLGRFEWDMTPGKFANVALSSLKVYLPHEDLTEQQLRELSADKVNSSNLEEAVSNFSKSRTEFREYHVSNIDFKSRSDFVEVNIKFSLYGRVRSNKSYKITKKNLSHYL
ncbi:FhaB protein [Vibrio campbellii]